MNYQIVIQNVFLSVISVHVYIYVSVLLIVSDTAQIEMWLYFIATRKNCF